MDGKVWVFEVACKLTGYVITALCQKITASGSSHLAEFALQAAPACVEDDLRLCIYFVRCLMKILAGELLCLLCLMFLLALSSCGD